VTQPPPALAGTSAAALVIGTIVYGVFRLYA
jgi:hypothetical protein